MPTPNAESNPLADFLDEYRKRKREFENQDWTFSEPPGGDFDPSTYRLRPMLESGLAPLPKAETLDAVRDRMPELVRDYFTAPTTTAPKPLIIRSPAGVGKTHAALEVVQELARSGGRYLWCSDRHSAFEDMALHAAFDQALWYHWQPIGGEIASEPACRYAEYQREWSQRGYKALELCRAVCSHDKHIQVCPYRCQTKRKEPLIFAMHQHLITGLSLGEFDGAVIDELPLSAFVKRRRIKPEHIVITEESGPVKELLTTLTALTVRNKTWGGKELFDEIGELLGDVYAHAELADLGDVASPFPKPPRIYAPEQVKQAKYFFLYDFLLLASAEYQCWRSGWPRWAERVRVSAKGLMLLSRNRVWDKLPTRRLILDATGRPELYSRLLESEVDVYAPRVKRIGKLFQVAGRMNGKGKMMVRKGRDNFEITEAGQEALRTCRLMADKQGYTRPGVVCHLAIEDHFKREFGAENVMHFGAMRGTNLLMDCDGGFVVGTHGPGINDIVDIATALDEKRVKPFTHPGDTPDDKPLPLYQWGFREFRLTRAALKDWPGAQGVERLVGQYADADLRAVHIQLRDSEIIQAVHRFRINVQKNDVWLLSGMPLDDEPVDALYQDPPLGPPGINWRTWAKISPWLETQTEVDYKALAEFCGASLNYARENDWLVKIADYAAGWEFCSKERVGKAPGLYFIRKST